MEVLIAEIERLVKEWRATRSLLPQPSRDSFQSWKRVELTYHSNALEGNTLSALETAQLLEHDLTVGGKTLREHLEARNHDQALRFVELRACDPQPIQERDLLAIHQQILTGINDEWAGRYRNGPVRIAGSSVVLPNALKVPVLMEALGIWLSDAQSSAVIRAVEAHERLVSIHPFFDGNGRTARLLMNLILMQADYPAVVIPVSERLNYLQSLEQAQTGQGRTAYEYFMYTCIRKELEGRLDFIRENCSEN